jgi:5-oxoprolinase (ATP-hydrolysing) subunit C
MSLVVVRAFGLVTIQDRGRPGWMHEAVPPGGALVPELLARANRSAGNASDAPAIEVCGRLVVRAEGTCDVATDRQFTVLSPGEELLVESEPRRVAYLAIAGGVEAPLVLGGRGTLLCAGIGRLLRAGDVIAASNATADAAGSDETIVDVDRDAPIRIVAGPDRDAFADTALGTLTSTPYRVLPSSNRVGTRLGGPLITRVAGYRETSRPMIRGAIEVPADGQPIVLGPEHPTTGGYPLVAVVASADLGRLFATRLGGAIRFAQ